MGKLPSLIMNKTCCGMSRKNMIPITSGMQVPIAFLLQLWTNPRAMRRCWPYQNSEQIQSSTHMPKCTSTTNKQNSHRLLTNPSSYQRPVWNCCWETWKTGRKQAEGHLMEYMFQWGKCSLENPTRLDTYTIMMPNCSKKNTHLGLFWANHDSFHTSTLVIVP